MFVYYCLMAKLIKKTHNEPNKWEINVFCVWGIDS